MHKNLLELSDQHLAEDFGDWGRSILQKMKDFGVSQIFYDALPKNVIAAYAKYYLEDDGKACFLNKILYTNQATSSIEDFLFLKIEESIHAIQYNTVPVLFAVPENINTPVILCPEDRMWIEQLIEIHAQSNATLMMKRAFERSDALNSKNLSFDVLDKRQIQLYEENSEEVITRVLGSLLLALPMKMEQYQKQTAVAFLEGACARTKFLRGIDWNPSIREPLLNDVTYCRLGPEDMQAIGNSFGMNVFEGSIELEGYQSILEPPRIIGEARKFLEELNKFCGITNGKETLPTLSEALTAQGITRGNLFPKEHVANKRPQTPSSSFPSYPL